MSVPSLFRNAATAFFLRIFPLLLVAASHVHGQSQNPVPSEANCGIFACPPPGSNLCCPVPYVCIGSSSGAFVCEDASGFPIPPPAPGTPGGGVTVPSPTPTPPVPIGPATSPTPPGLSGGNIGGSSVSVSISVVSPTTTSPSSFSLTTTRTTSSTTSSLSTSSVLTPAPASSTTSGETPAGGSASTPVIPATSLTVTQPPFPIPPTSLPAPPVVPSASINSTGNGNGTIVFPSIAPPKIYNWYGGGCGLIAVGVAVFVQGALMLE